MNKYEYLDFYVDYGIFSETKTVIVTELSSKNIHDFEDLKQMLNEINHSATAIEKLNEIGWELVNIYTSGEGTITHCFLKRLKK